MNFSKHLLTLILLAPLGTFAQAQPYSTRGTSSKVVKEFQSAVRNAIMNKTDLAKKTLLALLSADKKTIPQDQINITLARIEYQENHLDKALDYYNQIPQTSDYWVESIEEKAWTQHRKKDYEKALSELKTLMAPQLAAQVGPEVYYLSSFTNLKMCNYPEILKLHKEFKAQYTPRLLVLQNLVNTGSSPATQKLIDRLQMGSGSKWTSLGPDVEKLPRMINKDHELNVLARQKPTSSVTKSITGRIKKLAQQEVSELRDMVKKLQIIEVEAIEHMAINNRVANKTVELSKSDDDDTLLFPDNGEVWMDELTHYEVKGKGCPDTMKSLAAKLQKSKTEKSL